MVNELKLKGNELLVYAIIYGFSQKEGSRYTGSLQYLADWLNTSKQTVLNCLQNLLEKDFINKEEKIINNVKFCEYWSKNLNTPSQNFLMGGGQKFLTNNKYNINNKIIIDESMRVDEDMPEFKDMTFEECCRASEWLLKNMYCQEITKEKFIEVVRKFKNDR